MHTRVMVGVVASNQPAKTLNCVRALAASKDVEVGLYLVDNGCGGGLVDAVHAIIKPCGVTQLGRNVGAAAGRNHVIQAFLREESWDLLLFVDNDLYVQSLTIRQAVDGLRRLQGEGVRVGGIGIHIAYRCNPALLWCSGGGRIDWDLAWFTEMGRNETRDVAHPATREVDSIPTAFMLCEREAVARTGFMNSVYGIYLEDADWCWRMKRQGFRLFACSAPLAEHDVSSSVGHGSPRFHYLRTRNRLWFFQAYSPRGRRATRAAIWRSVSRDALQDALASCHVRCATALLLGFLAGCRLPRALGHAPHTAPVDGN